ncbi:ABC transporter ATP-binding protein [Corynebacterium freiburgense]|uniref:ABC transporter ATP-binding protein n=1 Tax=Corynebacterium freiburgense TaxID=556548 RepID=UPI000428B793|nr:ABC transporter ATP-binding protein [Corynebacterium freiburgense]WJZ03055.1 Putative multidrug export ATP-binding/permease protein [Corynebacterium freiburgense]
MSERPLQRTLHLVGPHIKPERKLIAGGTLALIFEVCFRVLEPWPLKIVIDAVSVSIGADIHGQSASLSLLIWCGIALLTIVGLRALSNYCATVAFALVGSRAATTLRMQVFKHVQRLPQQFHSKNRSADTVQRIVADVNRMQEVAVTAGLPLLANIITFFVMLIVMFILDPVLSLVVVGALALFYFSSRGTSKRIARASRKTRKAEGQLANTAQESLSAIEIVQSYVLESIISNRFVSANTTSLNAGVSSRRLAARLERTTDGIVGIATALVMVGGALRVLDGAMTLGDLVLFTTYLRTTMKPLRDMAKYTGRIARATASGERVADLVNITSDIRTPTDPVVPYEVKGHVQFENVHTEYDENPVLQGFNLTVKPGELVAIIGPSGAGKSTLVSLLVRAIDPTKGKVMLDGHPVKEIDLVYLRELVSILHQEAVLFTGTIRENIRFGRSNATDEEIVEAAKAARAHQFIMSFPDGYDTQVGERGGTLSGGQRQRIAIARALLRNSPVVVLDEPTTGLDPESATLVMEAIQDLVAGRTTLAVTHDPEVALRAQRVVWVQDGRVLLDGSPAELQQTSEAFQDWVSAGEHAITDIRIGEAR